MTEPILRVDGLRVELTSGTPIVDDVSLRIERGEILGVIGESGSGKTTLALALLGYHRPGIRRTRGMITIAGERLTEQGESRLRRLRGRLVSYVPQEPATALNPSIRIGAQIMGMLRAHASERATTDAVRDALKQVHLPSDDEFIDRFPHQLSGGQQQRVAIGVALVCRPAVVVLDEPTTGLDVIVQRGFLTEVERLAREAGVGILYVSHDLAVVGSIAGRIAVMYAGRIVEQGAAADLAQRPKHPYTHGLVSAVPDHLAPRHLRGIPGVARGVGSWGNSCAFAPRCSQRRPRCDGELPELEPLPEGREVRCFEWSQTPPLGLELPMRDDSGSAPTRNALLEVIRVTATHRSRRHVVTAAEEVSFNVLVGECVALVGESGSGKTTIARCVIGLHEPDSGDILLDGSPLARRAARRSIEERRRLQIVFQNPYDSLNLRHRVAAIIQRPAHQLRGLRNRDAEAEARRLLELVRLPANTAERYPAELSGGERQRVAIARALAGRPDLLVCDEVTSALDVSVQAAVLELLADLRKELSLSMLFISHDLGVVASVADRVLVLTDGRTCEQGPVQNLLERPSHEYTRRLIAAAPRLVEADGLDRQHARGQVAGSAHGPERGGGAELSSHHQP
jgi:peptide/nickel transport system ATP-binding protein